MSSPLDHVVALAAAVPGAAHVTADHAHDALRVRVAPGADGADVALAVGRLLASARDGALGGPRRTVTLPSAQRGNRPRIARIDLRTDSSGLTVGVGLECAARSGQGSARGALTTTGTRRAVATATLQAVRSLLPEPVHLELEHVECTATAPEPVVVVTVTLVCPTGVQRLAGSAVVREDESSAVVRAALDAVNRRVEALVDGTG